MQLEILVLITQQPHRVPVLIFVCIAALSAIAAQQLPIWMPATWLAMVLCIRIAPRSELGQGAAFSLHFAK